MQAATTDYISPDTPLTLDGLFQERARRTPHSIAYRYFDTDLEDWQSYTWAQMSTHILWWQVAFQREGLTAGDRVAVMLKNCPEWIIFDQAALGLGLIVVPLYTADRPENTAYCLHDSGTRLLLLGSARHWQAIHETAHRLTDLKRIVIVNATPDRTLDARLCSLAEWLPEMPVDSDGSSEPKVPIGSKVPIDPEMPIDKAPLFKLHQSQDPQALASIVYTSGTSGRPKGVMLTHRNMLSNAWAGLKMANVYPEDLFLSFLPLSHTLERTVGYYLAAMAGASVAFARSIQQLQEDMIAIRPTCMVVVPRIFERINAAMRNQLHKSPVWQQTLFSYAHGVGYSVFERQQGRGRFALSHLLWPILKYMLADKVLARFGGRMRIMLSGSAALSPDIAKVFIGLGVPLIQGYGLTEASPVVSVNRLEDNHPAGVGHVLPGIQIHIDESQVLHVKGDNVMQGYWNDPVASSHVLKDGWLDTGDLARQDETGRLTIIGRKKEIIVLSNGEKVSPVDMENAILRDPLFYQVMIAGEGKSYLSALLVVNHEVWQSALKQHPLPGEWPQQLESGQALAFGLSRVALQVKDFPGYARIRRVTLLSEPWTIENGALTPTLKLRRQQVLAQHTVAYDAMYQGLKLH